VVALAKKSKSSNLAIFIVLAAVAALIVLGLYFIGSSTGDVTQIASPKIITAEYGKPDLVVTDISWNYNANFGVVYIVSVTVKNQGTAKASNFEVKLMDTTNNQELFPPVAANQQPARCKLTIEKGKTGICTYHVVVHGGFQTLPATLQATADTSQKFGLLNGVVRESNENNNVLSAKVSGCGLTAIGKCGNGRCEKDKPTNNCPDRSETTNTCFDDCPPVCGDKKCDEVEAIGNGIVFGDGNKTVTTKWACKADCKIVLGDGVCDQGEAAVAGGYIDCGKCGDGVCDPNEYKDAASMKADIQRSNDNLCKLNPKFCKVCAADC